ncbi:MAG: class I SAM-dependent methyltransferase, partial [Bryobacteraceae bacterium]
MRAPYDGIAAVYDRYWGSAFAIHARKAVETHLASRLPRRAAVLDLCCGSGLLLRELDALGYDSFGVDESAGMLEVARQNAPDAVLQRADMAAFEWDYTFDAAICLYNSL